MRRLILAAIAIVATLMLYTVPVAFGQDGDLPVLTDPTAAALASAAGIAAVVALITNVLRTTFPAESFDRWGPTIAVLVGIFLGLIGVVVGAGPKDGNAIVTAVLIGLFGGWQSQNVNTQVKRALGDT